MKKLTLLFVVASLFMIFSTIAAADHYSDGKLLQKTINKDATTNNRVSFFMK